MPWRRISIPSAPNRAEPGALRPRSGLQSRSGLRPCCGLRPCDGRGVLCGRKFGLTLVAGALAGLLTTACGSRERAAQGRDPAVATIAAERAGLGEPGVRGRILYQNYCAVCHGDTGAGDGFNSTNLAVPPPDLRAVVAAHGEALVAQVVRDGSGAVGKSALCPPYGRTLDDSERQLIVGYVRGLKADESGTPAAK
jgi:mono/diheme cytochrome c family protein